jgi:hypothetical protein
LEQFAARPAVALHFRQIDDMLEELWGSGTEESEVTYMNDNLFHVADPATGEERPGVTVVQLQDVPAKTREECKDLDTL